ncbi:MAG: undecaprenyl-phosphate alpha-N-acetylglucosaminyl 1-phosphate transferase [Dehalococcoidia bacterium]|nr:MAG: undecaprenyl-phosphate alpha-N-acetylglucosaminyl 1-phosphate transferase [Dehalococcoidia bacterium]
MGSLGLELGTAAVAFLVAFPLTALLRLPTKAGRRGELIPKIGGLSILAAFVAAPFVMALFSDKARDFVSGDFKAFLALAGTGAVVCAVGARDDFRDIDWRIKMSAHFGAAVVLYISGFRIGEMTLPGGGNVELGLLDPVVTVLWIVLVTNAINLIDGYDGVAAGVGVLVAGTMSYIAWDLGHDLIAMLFAALAGASLGFLPFNLTRASRFLGDSGAYLLGFTIAGLSVNGALDSTGRVPLYIPLVALGLPVLDTGVAFVRRVLDNKHPFLADHDHFHDRIERMLKLSRLQVTLVTYVLTAVFCAGAVLAHTWYKSAGSAAVGAGVVVFALLLILVLGYGSSMWNSARILSLRGRHPGAEERV